MIKIEKKYQAEAIFTEDKSNTWDAVRDKEYKVSIFGLTLFKRTEKLNIDYREIELKKLGFKK